MKEWDDKHLYVSWDEYNKAIEDLAVMRPGKANLRNYDWKTIAKTVWDKPADGSYYFKKAHAVAYAHLVALHINLLEEGE